MTNIYIAEAGHSDRDKTRALQERMLCKLRLKSSLFDKDDGMCFKLFFKHLVRKTFLLSLLSQNCIVLPRYRIITHKILGELIPNLFSNSFLDWPALAVPLLLFLSNNKTSIFSGYTSENQGNQLLVLYNIMLLTWPRQTE